MEKNLKKRLNSLLLSVMLIVAMAFTFTGCGKQDPAVDITGSVSAEVPSSATVAEQPSEDGSSAESTVPDTDEGSKESEPSDAKPSESEASADNVLGEGETAFAFTVIDKEGNETAYEIHTDKETVGDALLENGLIAGEESTYGLYVKQVIGITADYDVDQTYWAFYVNGEYATSGVDTTPVKAGETYTFKVE